MRKAKWGADLRPSALFARLAEVDRNNLPKRRRRFFESGGVCGVTRYYYLWGCAGTGGAGGTGGVGTALTGCAGFTGSATGAGFTGGTAGFTGGTGKFLSGSVGFGMVCLRYKTVQPACRKLPRHPLR